MSGTGDPRDQANQPAADNTNVNTQTVTVGSNKVSWIQVLAGIAAAATLVAFGVTLVSLLDNGTEQSVGAAGDTETTTTTSAVSSDEAAAPSISPTAERENTSASESSLAENKPDRPSNAGEAAEQSAGLTNLLEATVLDDDKIECEPIHLIDAWPIGDEVDQGLNLSCDLIRLIRADRNDEKVVVKKLHEDVSSIGINAMLVDQVFLLAYIAPDANADNTSRRPGGWFHIDGGPDGLWLGQSEREEVLLYPDDGGPAVDLVPRDYENQIEIIRLYLAEELSTIPGSLIMVSAGSSLQEPKVQIHIGE